LNNKHERFLTAGDDLSKIVTLTIFSFALRTPSFPNRTWNGEATNVPSGCSTTRMSIAPAKKT